MKRQLRIIKKAIVVGETKLCIQCIAQLLERGWQVYAVISEDNEVIRWGTQNNVCILPYSNLIKLSKEQFYLFSIANPYIIPISFLFEKQVILALNYHDSLLPRYAGVNSTTWAILNEEKTHGVTLHKIAHSVDAGEVVAKADVPIEDNETAFSLNLKCSERLLQLFDTTLLQIEQNSLTFFKQDIAQRTYFGARHLPPHYGVINGVKDLNQIFRLARSLELGEGYVNPVASLKIFIGGKFYILKNFNTQALCYKAMPFNNPLPLFLQVRDIYGNLVNQVVTARQLTKKIALSTEELVYLAEIKSKERGNRKAIQRFLDTYDAPKNILPNTRSDENGPKYTKTISVQSADENMIVFVYVLLARFFHEKFLITLYLPNLFYSKKLQRLVDYKAFLCIDKQKLTESFSELKNYLQSAQQARYAIVKDFAYRYQLELLTDIAISFETTKYIDKHALLIQLSKDELKFIGLKSHRGLIDSMSDCMSEILSQTSNPSWLKQDLSKVNILNTTQYQRLLYQFNSTYHDYLKNTTLHELFEQQVEKTPQSIALIEGQTQLSYRQLNARANQLARYLKKKYVIRPNDFIGLYSDTTHQTIIALLAILKTSAAYIPLNPSTPHQRSTCILQDAQINLVLTSQRYQALLHSIVIPTCQVVVLDCSVTQSDLDQHGAANLAIPTSQNNLAYAIYTSGTTGKPKGVMIEHRTVINYVQFLIRDNQLSQKSMGSQFADLGFDACVIEIYPILLAGGKLCLMNASDKLSPEATNFFFHKNKINYAFLPTQFAELFFELKNDSLANLIVGGDKLNKFICQNYCVKNAYGPTEATVQATSFIVKQPQFSIPIGKPIDNAKCYVVDKKLNPVPMYAAGELLIGGKILAKGYINLPELTVEKFIANPFQTYEEQLADTNAKVYKTGDLVFWRSDGNLEYLGRNDTEIKIRGYRIELGEVTHQLQAISGITQVLITVHESDAQQKSLCAYYTTNQKININQIRAELSTKLNSYMIPEYFVHVEQFPVNQSGKIVPHLLPKPTTCLQSYIPPTNKQEHLICDAFSKILNIEKVGIHHDFFNFGGDSIKAILLTSELQNNFDIHISDLYSLKTPEKLAYHLSKITHLSESNLEKVKILYQAWRKQNKINELEVQPELVYDAVDRHGANRSQVTRYLNSTASIKIDSSNCKNISHLLLTGATGFLGCHILEQLLTTTSHRIYLLIRSESEQHAFERINQKFLFYFNKTLHDVYNTRVFVYASDIQKNDLGLSQKTYQFLVRRVDSIIHSAALVKYYGQRSEFYKHNVRGTINLLEFSRLTTLKDFHFISTRSVPELVSSPNNSLIVLTEEQDLHPLNKGNPVNFYIQSKYEAEQQVIQYRKLGVQSNIYRIGNLAFALGKKLVQENFEDNGFFNQTKCFLTIGAIFEELGCVEISPVDKVAYSILKIFDKRDLGSQTYHVFNPHLFDIIHFFKKEQKWSVKVVEIEEFIKTINCYFSETDSNLLIRRFLLYRGWLDFPEASFIKRMVLQNKTLHILKQLGFEWPRIDADIFNEYIKNNYGFLSC